MKRGSKPKPEVSPEIAAISRLTNDGASSNAAIRKRIAFIAADRKLGVSLIAPICVPIWGEGGQHLGPKFGPKHGDTRHYQAVLDVIADRRKAYKNLHKLTKRYRSIRSPSYFKTGALNHSATLPNQYFQVLSACSE
jgi:hypothetical protein